MAPSVPRAGDKGAQGGGAGGSHRRPEVCRARGSLGPWTRADRNGAGRGSALRRGEMGSDPGTRRERGGEGCPFAACVSECTMKRPSTPAGRCGCWWAGQSPPRLLAPKGGGGERRHGCTSLSTRAKVLFFFAPISGGESFAQEKRQASRASCEYGPPTRSSSCCGLTAGERCGEKVPGQSPLDLLVFAGQTQLAR